MLFRLFDIDTIKVNKWRWHYGALLNRYTEQAHFIEQDYKLGKESISVGFFDIDHANAFVDIVSDGYSIGIAGSFPYLLKALFSRLLAEPDVLPWLSMDKSDPLPDFEVSYAINSDKIGEQRFEQINTTIERERIALLLSDIAMEFVFLHDVAHIICGHVDAKKIMTPNQPQLTELSLTRQEATENASLSRAFECEADLIASNLLKTYVDVIIQKAELDELEATQTENHIEQCIALSLMSLYVLFRFLRGTTENLDLVGFYPDPLVRAYAVRGGLFQSMSEKYQINKDICEELIDMRLGEASDALDQIGVTPDDTKPSQLQGALTKLFNDRNLHASSLTKYRYFNWD